MERTGLGIQFYRWDSGSIYTLIGDVTSITPGNTTTEAISEDLLSKPGNFQTYIAGIKTIEPLSLVVNLIPGMYVPGSIEQQGQLFQDLVNGLLWQYRILFNDAPNPDKWQTFNAVITSWTVSDKSDAEKMQATFNFQLSGKDTYGAEP